MRRLLLAALLLTAPLASAGTFSKPSSDGAVRAPAPTNPVTDEVVRRVDEAVERIWRLRYRDADARMARAVSLYEAQKQIHEDCLRSAGRDWCNDAFVVMAAREVLAARDWLEDGLPDLCRRSGQCLPGWVR